MKSLLATALLMLLFGIGCKTNKHDAGGAGEPPQVEISLPVVLPVQDFLEFQGRTESPSFTNVRAQVGGILKAIYFTEGAEVVGKDRQPHMIASTIGMMAAPAGPLDVAFSMHPYRCQGGDPLYLLDPDIYLAKVDKSEADLKYATATVEERRAAYEIAQDAKVGLGTSALEIAQRLGQLEQARANKFAADANLISAKKDLSFTLIQAETTGKTSDYKITLGNVIKPNADVLTTIASMEPMYVYFEVDDAAVQMIKDMVKRKKFANYKEAKVPVFVNLVSDGDAFPHVGYINFVDNKFKANTGTLMVRAELSNPLEAQGIRTFTPGLFCRVRVPLGEPASKVCVSEKALGQLQGQRFVFVVDDQNKVTPRPVKIGRLEGAFRVIEEGLSDKDKVITSGILQVQPGMTVAPTMVAMPGSEKPKKAKAAE